MAIDDVIDLFDGRSTRIRRADGQSETFAYRLLKPQAVASGTSGTHWPLVVYLHGIGERGDDNRAQLRFLPEWMAESRRLTRFPCFLLAPQCKSDRLWVETPRAFDRAAPRQPPRAQMQAVIAMLDEVLAKFPVDGARLYLTGLSMGGYGSWDLGTRLADRWAAVAPICGGGDELYADRLSGVAVWAWHGDADDVVPVRKSRSMIEAMRRAGGHPRYTELAGIGHDCWTPAYHDSDELLDWMFAQHKA